jgi:hypothetical protein
MHEFCSAPLMSSSRKLTECFPPARFDVELHFTSHGSQRHPIEVEVAVVVRPHRYVRCDIGLTEQIQREYRLW